MTNKLPVVGNKYEGLGEVVEVVAIRNDDVIYWDIRRECASDTSLKHFMSEYEELPEDKSETKPEIKSPELSDEVKEAMEDLENEINNFSYDPWKDRYNFIVGAAQALTNAINEQFKVNKTSESVDVKEEEVEEKEFFWAAVGQLIEYQGKKYICINQTNYLPNERAEDWKEEGHTSKWCKHTKIKFRDIFANIKIQAEVANSKIEPNQNGNFKHLDNAEKISQDTMKEESIWKPVSELNIKDYSQWFLIKCNDGDIDIRLGAESFCVEEKFIPLTDFINDYEDLKKRVIKLEGK